MPEGPDIAPLSPWDRHDSEGPEAWEAFITYRDMGLARSTVKVAQALGKSTTLMHRWSSAHAWVARCEAWDEELDRERRAELRQAVREMAAADYATGSTLIDAGLKALAEKEPEDINAHQSARLIQTGVTIRRLSMGEPVPSEASEGDEAAAASLLESMRRYFTEREGQAFLDGAAAARAVESEPKGT